MGDHIVHVSAHVVYLNVSKGGLNQAAPHGPLVLWWLSTVPSGRVGRYTMFVHELNELNEIYICRLNELNGVRALDSAELPS